MIKLLSDLTLNNPIFMIVFFGAIWYLPGLVLKRRRDFIRQRNKDKDRKEKISRLYPKDNSEIKS